MKRVIAVCLCFLMIFTLAACSKGGKKGELEVDIEYYAKLGSMPDMEYALGDDVEETENVLSKSNQDEDHGDYIYSSYEVGEKTVMSNGNICCCYETENKDNGITHIVKYGGAFGFNQGAVSTQIRDTLAAAGYEAKEREAESGELFFIPGAAGITVLQYDFKENTVLFVFQDHSLSAGVVRVK